MIDKLEYLMALARERHFGKAADACGVTQASVWQAKQAGRVSAELALLIERATAGEITARQLRPDLPWPDLAPDAHAPERAAS